MAYYDDFSPMLFPDSLCSCSGSTAGKFPPLKCRPPSSCHRFVTNVFVLQSFYVRLLVKCFYFLFYFHILAGNMFGGGASSAVPPSSDFSFGGTSLFAYYDDFFPCYFRVLCVHALDLQLVSSPTTTSAALLIVL